MTEPTLDPRTGPERSTGTNRPLMIAAFVGILLVVLAIFLVIGTSIL